MDESLSRLTSLARQLADETRSLNDRIALIEYRLGELGIELPVWLDRAIWHSAPKVVRGAPTLSGVRQQTTSFREHRLGYATTSGGWRIAVQVVNVRVTDGPPVGKRDESIHGEPRPLAETPQYIRVAALPLIPVLVETLERVTESAIGALRDDRVIAE